MDRRVRTADSQLHRLLLEAERQGLRHGDTARVNLQHVRLSPNARGEETIYFCATTMEVLQILQKGDNGPLPQEVTVRRLGKLPARDSSGYFELEAYITSNGVITLERVLSPVSAKEWKTHTNVIPESRQNFVSEAHIPVPARALMNEVRVTADN